MRNYGSLNGPIIGHVMKKCVQNAIRIVRGLRISAEVHVKPNPEGKVDYVTEADLAAQKEYGRILQNCFPTFGIVAEESGLSISSAHPDHDLWFTVDPLDGTKAFVRGQSHGVGTMLSLVCDGEVIAAYVGDVMTGEIYGYRPDSDKVHRIGDFSQVQALSVDRRRSLTDQQIVLRDHPSAHSAFVRAMAGIAPGTRNRFRGLDIDSGSIGIDVARLWKGEVGALVLKAGRQTPWDLCPVLGISHKLGFRFLPLLCRTDEPSGWGFGQDVLTPSMDMQDTPTETLIVHESRLDELASWTW